jgi:hypothetical protein
MYKIVHLYVSLNKLTFVRAFLARVCNCLFKVR